MIGEARGGGLGWCWVIGEVRGGGLGWWWVIGEARGGEWSEGM